MVSFLHTADLHLGMRLTRFDPKTAQEVREARFAALDNVLREIRERRVDFLLIAGDLFDDDAVDLKTAGPAHEMLDACPVPVYVLPGNHDPLLAGGVWDRPPWNQPSQRVRVLRRSEPVEVKPGVVLYPCPVLRKTSLADPTAWIAAEPTTAGVVRIGVAHGSLKVRDDLPADDHLIARDAATALKLDYLALGHWHRRQLFTGSDGVERTAYCGVHEPMSYQGNRGIQIGWVPYGSEKNAERAEFLDAGVGEVLQVTLPGPGKPPELQPVEVGHLTWLDETREISSADDLSRLIDEVATRPDRERRLYRLKVTGILDAPNMLRLERLREIVEGRYFFGELDHAELRLQPSEEELRRVAGPGVWRRVLDRLHQEAAGAESRRVAERAMLLLYQLAAGVRP